MFVDSMSVSQQRCSSQSFVHSVELDTRPSFCVGAGGKERIAVRSSHNILPMEGLAGKITSSLHESNFACYNCMNGTTSTADEYSFTSYKQHINLWEGIRGRLPGAIAPKPRPCPSPKYFGYRCKNAKTNVLWPSKYAKMCFRPATVDYTRGSLNKRIPSKWRVVIQCACSDVAGEEDGVVMVKAEMMIDGVDGRSAYAATDRNFAESCPKRYN